MIKTPRWIIDKALEVIKSTNIAINKAKSRIPKEYHDFLVLQTKSVKIFNETNFPLDHHAESLGIYSANDGLYVYVSKPYFTVEGRLQMLRDVHRTQNKKFIVHPPIMNKIDGFVTMSITIESELYGSATGLIEITKEAKGKGNPISKAQNIAINRALEFLGVGLIGHGYQIGLETVESLLAEPIQSELSEQAPQQEIKCYKVRIASIPTCEEDGSVLFNKVIHQNSSETLLWFPAKHSQRALELKMHEYVDVVGFYDPHRNCLNIVTNYNASIPVLEQSESA